MSILFRHGWVLFVLGTCANGAIWWFRAQKEIVAKPTLEAGYRRLIRGLLIYGNLPWLVMGAGMVLGGVPTVSDFFNPRNGPWMIAWYVSVVLIWVLSFIWLFFRSGAEMLIEHPGLLRGRSQSPRDIKITFLIAISGGVIAILAMVTRYLPRVAR